jgi:Peptidase family M1 domain
MRRLIVGLCVVLPLFLSAQHKLDYQLQVHADLLRQTFAVKGSLTFETQAGSADSVDITISRGVGAAKWQLEGATGRMDTSVNNGGDIVYRWHFAPALPPHTPLRFTYAYERGNTPSFQYYLDTTFCMAGGYGSAWYPQVISREADSTGSITRGTASIAVATSGNRMPVMAASTLDTAMVAGERTYTFHYTQPDIFSLYIGDYSRQEYKGNRSFYTYSLSDAIDGNDLSRKSAAVLDFLSAQFGPLTIPNFSIIEFPEYVAEKTGIGGASILGGVVMPTGALLQFNYALFGHEIGHQWWGNKIQAKGERGADILSEGLAQYSSLQTVYRFDSIHAMDYRKTGYPGYIKDQCGLGYLKNAAAGNDEPLVALTGANGHILADSKGFLALELLSSMVGKPVFNKAMQVIGEKYSSSGVSWEDFQREIEKAYGHPLQHFFDQWFARTGAPAWQSSWQQQQNKLQLTITQKDSIYELPLEVMITYGNGTTSLQHITLRDRSHIWQLPVNGRVTAVQIDPYFKVLHQEATLITVAQSQARVIRVQNLRIQQKSAEAITLAQSYLREGIPGDSTGVAFALLYQLGRMTAVQNKPEEALAYYQRALQCASPAPELLAYTYYRIAQLAAEKKDNTLLQWACAHAVKADQLNYGADGMEARVAPLLAAVCGSPSRGR